jgi:guanylate cyclase
LDFVGKIFFISTGMAEVLNDGTRETYLEFFGGNFIHCFYQYGFNKILRVAGRTLRDFLFAIDQLHDSHRFTFPQMQHPLFHVTEEDEKGVTLVYK